jgi:hypothetical protein
MTEPRFALNTAQLLPMWLVVLFDTLLVLLAGVFIAGLWVHPGYVGGVILTLAMIALLHLMVRGFRDPALNFVRLGDDAFEVSVFWGFRVLGGFSSLSRTIPYSSVESVEENPKHRFSYLLGYWPITTTRPHVDITLRSARFLGWGYGRAFPWARVIHLELVEPQRFVLELRERVASAETA